MIVQPNQSMADIAINATGTLESVFQIAQANGLSITAFPNSGDELTIPAAAASDNSTLQYLRLNNISIGTRGLRIGIGFWTIGTDFTIS